MGTFTPVLSSPASCGPLTSVDEPNSGKAANGQDVPPDEVQPGQRGTVEGMFLSEREFKRLRGMASALELSELQSLWFKMKGPAFERELLQLAQTLAPEEQRPEVCSYQERFRPLLREALEWEEFGAPELLEVCRKALAECKTISDVDAFIDVQRVSSDLYESEHSQRLLGEQELRQLADAGGADGLAQRVGYPGAAPMIREMARDLLVSAWGRVLKPKGSLIGSVAYPASPAEGVVRGEGHAVTRCALCLTQALCQLQLLLHLLGGSIYPAPGGSIYLYSSSMHADYGTPSASVCVDRQPATQTHGFCCGGSLCRQARVQIFYCLCVGCHFRVAQKPSVSVTALTPTPFAGVPSTHSRHDASTIEPRRPSPAPGAMLRTSHAATCWILYRMSRWPRLEPEQQLVTVGPSSALPLHGFVFSRSSNLLRLRTHGVQPHMG